MIELKYREKFNKIHNNDKDQLDFVFSNEKRLIVTAPAGCGKTKSMVSKIAYELISTKGATFKKILALTFSVNAASKIKDDTSTLLPNIIGCNSLSINKKLEIANYHSFAKRLIRNHGYYLDESFKNIEDFKIIEDKKLYGYFGDDEKDNVKFLQQYKVELNNSNSTFIEEYLDYYYDIVIDKLINNRCITYDSMLVLAIVLLEEEPIRKFYSNYYQMVIVDEFQDTNCLSYMLIKSLSFCNKLILIGDEMQKIYGFIGAIPNIFQIAKLDFNMSRFEFTTNYRFKDNIHLKQLDKYLREVSSNYDILNNGFNEKATLKIGFYETPEGENSKIVKMIQSNIANDYTSVILFRVKNMARDVKAEFDNKGVKYFNGLFSDIDTFYKEFHDEALRIFNLESGCSKSVSKKTLNKVVSRIKKEYTSTDSDIATSLIQLLQVFFTYVRNKNILRKDKYSQIQFTLSSYSLKRYMNEIKEKVILTTIHGSKGLEWDYVFIPGGQESKFPFYYGLCEDCKKMKARIISNNYCIFKYPKLLKDQFLVELSVFYVAVTRAKKDVYIFANFGETYFGSSKLSCLASLPNLELLRIL